MRWTTLMAVWGMGCSGHEASPVDRDDDDTLPGLVDSAPVTDTGDDALDAYTTRPTGGSETCLYVQGGNDRVRATAVGTPVGQAPHTLQVWIRTASLDDQVAASHGLASPGKALYVGTSGGHPMVSDGGLLHVDDEHFVADGAWHHLAVSFDGEVATLTIDGERGVGFALPDLDLVEGEVVAGAAPTNGGLAWVGWIDDMMLFGRERTYSDLLDPYTEDDRGLLVWWDFEVDGSGPGVDVPDASGSRMDGVSGGSEGTPDFLPCR